MKTHRWMSPASTQVPTGPARNPSAAARSSTARRAVRRIIVPGLALGALVVTVMASGQASAGHGSVHYGTTTDHLAASVPAGSGHAIADPWIY
jgi:hypothetical protein